MTRRTLCLAGLLLAFVPLTAAQGPGLRPAVDPASWQELKYRLVGPFRAGRTVGAVGVPSQPGTYVIGVNDGGVWRTTDYGRTWRPIFDSAPTGSVGDVAVSPSDPDVIYVGTGEGLQRPDLSVGDGVFKTTDGGRSWSHLGLSDVQQVSRLAVHPTDPRTVFVAAMGHPYGPNGQRGVFRTRDGGQTWDKVLYVDEDTGASQVELDPSNPETVYAALWQHCEGPWENGLFSGPNSGLFKSADGGTTWRRLSRGLPDAGQGLGQVIVAIAPSAPARLYALVSAREGRGVYRSDDAGDSWALVSTDARLGVDLRVHPKNPDVVFSAGTASYRSDDGGKTWTSIKGAPGGDDYQRIWINPLQPDFMIFTADQGATITTNGGRTWSSWYNQPTAQLYHVAADNQFPYWVYGGQQESGAIGIASRGNGGQVSFRDWIGVGADEYAYVAPDPLNPDIVYGGRVQRFNKKTGQSQNVAPEALRSADYRVLRTMPLTFHPADAKTLLFATNVLWKTTTGGESWTMISPDLSRERTEVPESVGVYSSSSPAAPGRRGVIYALGPSPLDVNVIWAGTDDGLVHVTRDGGDNWSNVTPKELRAWDKVSQVDAGHFDAKTAYIAVNAMRRDDMRPHVFRTHDGGASWDRVVDGLPANGPVNVVREDPRQRGLLFAGTERQVFVSFDDGGHWQSLRLNMPATSMRDLVVHENDLVVGTHGRSIWILDDITPLRELAAGVAPERPHLFTPALATRVRWNMFSDTPLPPEEPAGQNPPDGGVIDYLLPRAAAEVVLEVRDGQGGVVRRYSSGQEPERIDPSTLPYPTYWFRPPQRVATSPGQHRVVWDLRYEPPRGTRRSYSIAAIYRNTPSGPQGPYVHPGRYTVRLTVDGVVLERPIEVRLDPRVTLAPADLQLQTDLSMACYRGADRAQTLRAAVDRALAGQGIDAVRRSSLAKLRGHTIPGDPDILYDSITVPPVGEETLGGLQEKFLYMLNLLQAADAKPTRQAQAAVDALQKTLVDLESKAKQLL